MIGQAGLSSITCSKALVRGVRLPILSNSGKEAAGKQPSGEKEEGSLQVRQLPASVNGTVAKGLFEPVHKHSCFLSYTLFGWRQ